MPLIIGGNAEFGYANLEANGGISAWLGLSQRISGFLWNDWDQ
jgi:hypothetical protein